MKSHQYRVTVEHLALPDGSAPANAEPIRFEAGNHDDLTALVALAKQRGDLPAEDATAFIIGLKLFGEVMLKHRDLPLFVELSPHFKAFMQTLKRKPTAQGEACKV